MSYFESLDTKPSQLEGRSAQQHEGRSVQPARELALVTHMLRLRYGNHHAGHDQGGSQTLD